MKELKNPLILFKLHEWRYGVMAKGSIGFVN